jgi:hypothetical protein
MEVYSMTDNNHPITPPPALVEQWRTAPEYTTGEEMFTMVSMSTRRLQEVATQAARWGADMELEACCEWFFKNYAVPSSQLRAIRRPKPPSLKELALETFNKLEHLFDGYGYDGPTIRRALESLPD